MRKLLKDEKGFTLVELLVVISITAVATVLVSSLLVSANNISQKTKELNLAYDLIENYVKYYEDMDITRRDVADIFNESGKVDLVDSMYGMVDNVDDIPKHYKNMSVECESMPRMSEDSRFIEIDLKCELNGDSINKGQVFKIKKYISD